MCQCPCHSMTHEPPLYLHVLLGASALVMLQTSGLRAFYMPWATSQLLALTLLQHMTIT